jgi:hypothetical protein
LCIFLDACMANTKLQALCYFVVTDCYLVLKIRLSDYSSLSLGVACVFAVTPPGHFTASGNTTKCAAGSFRAGWSAAASATSCTSCGTGVYAVEDLQIQLYSLTFPYTTTSVGVTTLPGSCCKYSLPSRVTVLGSARVRCFGCAGRFNALHFLRLVWCCWQASCSCIPTPSYRSVVCWHVHLRCQNSPSCVLFFRRHQDRARHVLCGDLQQLAVSTGLAWQYCSATNVVACVTPA